MGQSLKNSESQPEQAWLMRNRSKLSAGGVAAGLLIVALGGIQAHEKSDDEPVVQSTDVSECFELQGVKLAGDLFGPSAIVGVEPVYQPNTTLMAARSRNFMDTGIGLYCATDDVSLQQVCEDTIPQVIDQLVGREINTEYTPPVMVERQHVGATTISRTVKIADKLTISLPDEHHGGYTYISEATPATCEIIDPARS